LLLTEREPLYFTAVDGSKVAVTVVLCFGASVIPAALPFAVNPAPDTATFEIVMFAVPVFVSVTDWLLPPAEMPTFPKFKLVELAFSTSELPEEDEEVESTTLQTFNDPVELNAPTLLTYLLADCSERNFKFKPTVFCVEPVTT
jgi:hypothetical protein